MATMAALPIRSKHVGGLIRLYARASCDGRSMTGFEGESKALAGMGCFPNSAFRVQRGLDPES